MELQKKVNKLREDRYRAIKTNVKASFLCSAINLKPLIAEIMLNESVLQTPTQAKPKQSFLWEKQRRKETKQTNN